MQSILQFQFGTFPFIRRLNQTFRTPPRQEVCTSLGWRSANLIYAPQPYLRVAANSDQVVTASDYMLIIIA